MIRKTLEHKSLLVAILAVIGLMAAAVLAMPVPLAGQEPPPIVGGVETQ